MCVRIILFDLNGASVLSLSVLKVPVMKQSDGAKYGVRFGQTFIKP
jgi:hypothetical protein